MQRPPAESLPHPPSAGWLSAGGRTVYLVPGRRVLVGSGPAAELRIDGPGILPRHLRVSLRAEGWLQVRPLGPGVFAGRRALRELSRVRLEEPLRIGFCTIETGATDAALVAHLHALLEDLRASGRAALRRAPVLLVSLVIHLLVLFVWLDRRGPRGGGEPGPSLALAIEPGGGADPVTGTELPEEPTTMPAEPNAPDFVPEPQPLPRPLTREEPAEGAEDPGLGADGLPGPRDPKAWLTDLGRGGRRGARSGPRIALPGAVGARLGRTVARMRRRGLDLVFVFDSTGSMSGVLARAKAQMQDLLRLLRALVPGTRVGLVTYRDREDAYRTRTCPLGEGWYRLLAFLAAIDARGGGDFEEAVDEGLRQASGLAFRQRAHRVVVLVGDAPPHPGGGMRRAIVAARRFAHAGRGQVHALVTGRDARTWQAMRSIARAGNGKAFALAESDALARTLLALAFGTEHREELGALLRRFQTPAGGASLPSPSLVCAALESPAPDPAILERYARTGANGLAALAPRLAGLRPSPEGFYALYYLYNRSLRPALLPPEAPARSVPPELWRSLLARASRRR